VPSPHTAVKPTPAAVGPAVRPTVRVGAVVGALGLLSVVLGTFLPWLVSGGVARNSYAIVGIVGRLGLAGTGFGATALSLWPFLGPVAMLPLIAAIIRWWRTAGVIALLFGLLTGVVGGGVLAVAGGNGGAGIALAYPGPAVTALGGLSAVVGSVLVLIGRRSVRRPAQDVSVSTEPNYERDYPR
jgi:hypothetical protein